MKNPGMNMKRDIATRRTVMSITLGLLAALFLAAAGCGTQETIETRDATGKLGFAVTSVCRKYFGIDAEYLGYVNHDEDVRRSVRSRRPVVDLKSSADASIYIQRIARKLTQDGARSRRSHSRGRRT